MRDNLLPALAAPKLALAVYLEALLRDAPEKSPAADSGADLITNAPAVSAEPVAVPPQPAAPFACLLFKAGGFHLAAPLDRLGGVVPWAPLTLLPAQAAHILGLLPHLGKQVQVLDPLPLLHPRAAARSRSHVVHSIVLSASREWGLACEAVNGIVTVHPERVRWRSGAAAQPWFSGIISDWMCVLLDMDVLARKSAGASTR